MSHTDTRYLVTGASGQLGRLVVSSLMERVPPSRIAVMVRRAEAATEYAARGLEVRIADYQNPDALRVALANIDRVLLISSNQFGTRVSEHRNVINAASQAGVSRLLYTSVLRADTSPLGLATDHRETEALLRASGVPFAILRNGWYTENYGGFIAPALAHGVLLGCAGDGRISSASRRDYAEAAAVVLTTEEAVEGRTFELAGDESYSLAEFAQQISSASDKLVKYQNVSQLQLSDALLQAGLPAAIADLLADCDAAAAKGALYSNDRRLSALIQRPTTPMRVTVDATVAELLKAAGNA